MASPCRLRKSGKQTIRIGGENHSIFACRGRPDCPITFIDGTEGNPIYPDHLPQARKTSEEIRLWCEQNPLCSTAEIIDPGPKRQHKQTSKEKRSKTFASEQVCDIGRLYTLFRKTKRIYN